jgi:hypothetical protein
MILTVLHYPALDWEGREFVMASMGGISIARLNSYHHLIFACRPCYAQMTL